MLFVFRTNANLSRRFESPLDPQPVWYGPTGIVLHQEPRFISGRIYRVGITGHLGAIFRPIPGNPVQAGSKAKR